MTLPETSVLDDFNRANGQLVANWSVTVQSGPSILIASNRVKVSFTQSGFARYDAGGGSFVNCESFLSVAAPNPADVSQFNCYAGIAGGTVSSQPSYQFQAYLSTIGRLSPSNNSFLRRNSSTGFWTANAPSTGVTANAISKVMLRVVYPLIEGWVQDSTGAWIRLIAVNDLMSSGGQAQLTGYLGFGLS